MTPLSYSAVDIAQPLSASGAHASGPSAAHRGEPKSPPEPPPSRRLSGSASLLFGISLAIAAALYGFLTIEARRSTCAQLDAIVAATADALPIHDAAATVERCRALGALPQVLSVAVYDRAGNLMASYARPDIAVASTVAADATRRAKDGTYRAVAVVVRGDEKLGEVRVLAAITPAPFAASSDFAACSMVLLVGIAVPLAFKRRPRPPTRTPNPKPAAAPSTEHPATPDPSGDSRLIHQSLLEHLPIFVYRKDPAGRFIYVSPQYCRLMRRKPGELMGRTLGDVEATPAAQHEAEQDRQMAATAETISYEARFETPGEPVRFFQIIKTPVRDAAGRFVGTQGMGLEITSLKEAQAEIARAEARFRFIFEAAPVGLAWMNPGDVASRVVNHQYAAVTGVPNEQCRQLELYRAATHPDDRKRQDEMHAQLIAGQIDQYVLEKRYVQPDGSLRWAMITVRYLRGRSPSDTQEISALVDITERKQAEAELDRLHKQLVDTSRHAGMAEVATSVLHNIGNVLNSVNVSATLLLQHAQRSRVGSLHKAVLLLQEHSGARLAEFFARDPRAQKLPDYLSALEEALSNENRHFVAEITALKTHIDHISDVVRMQQDYATVAGVTEPISITAIIEDALRINESAYSRHGVIVTREFAANPTFATDRHRVLDILVNLLQNAKNACTESGRDEKSVRISVEADAENVVVTITDNGVGIPTENLTRIFAHGFTTRANGHGFGLHSSAVSAKVLGGALVAASDGPGTGATFKLSLPLTGSTAGQGTK